MAKYLVTGACGFTGSHVVDMLHQKGCDLRATDMAQADRKYLPDDVEFVSSDLTDRKSLEKVVNGVDIIFHTAAIFNFSAPWNLLKSVNIDGMENLCEAALECGVKRLLSWSTCGVYGKIDPKKMPITEDHPKTPIDNYGKSKLMQDKIAHKYYEEKGLPITIVRPGVVYGPRSIYGAAYIITELAKLPIIPLPLNFNIKLSPINVKDIAGAAIFLSAQDAAVGEEFHIVDCSGATVAQFMSYIAVFLNKPTIPMFVPISLAKNGGLIVAEIAERITKLTKIKLPIEKDPIRHFSSSLDVSNEKLLNLGYKMLYPDVRIGLIETIEWYKQEGII